VVDGEVGFDEEGTEGAFFTASMRRGIVSAANMSPVPEKKSGSAGVSMRKRRGVKSEVAVEPIMVRSSTSSKSILLCSASEGFEAGALEVLDCSPVGREEGCDVSALRSGDLEGVWC
jgi:hypothetical protein